MDDKDYAKASLLPPATASARQAPEMVRQRRSRFQLAALLLVGAMFWMAMRWNCGLHHDDEGEVMKGRKVPLEIHIMYVFHVFLWRPPLTESDFSPVIQVPL